MIEFLPKDPLIATMAIHGISNLYGTEGLKQRFEIESEVFSSSERDLLSRCLDYSTSLHSGDFRGSDPYINHPLRVALRIMAHYEIEDSNVAAAALLHDVVEDHAKEIDLENGTKSGSLLILANKFNPRISKLVDLVTNPEFDLSRDRNEQYQQHVAEIALYGDPYGLVIKLSDFTDNATGINYAEERKKVSLANKYRPILEIFEKALLDRDDLPFRPEVLSQIYNQLQTTRSRLDTLIAA